MRTLAIPIVLSFIFLSFSLLSAQQIGAQNYTAQQANLTIANVSAYIAAVNQSGYLIFYPNLTTAYVYLDKAQSLYLSSPALAQTYAIRAQQSAALAYDTISEYKAYAFVFVVVLTILTAGIFYALARPVRRTKRAKR